MSEVEKMYENAEVDKECEKNYAYLECPHKTRQCEDCVLFIYPAFTIEKQLELLKWLAHKDSIQIVECDGFYYIRYNLTGWPDCSIGWELEGSDSNIDEAIAQLINKLWQNLEDYEQHRIKEILND